jgi:hypothetical protein
MVAGSHSGGRGTIEVWDRSAIVGKVGKSWAEARKARKSLVRLKKEGALREPKTWPTGMMRYWRRTYANAGARSG